MNRTIKIAVLTSSRADYGIYKPLLELLKKKNCVELEIIAFGMHLQEHHGMTIDEIERDDYSQIHRVIGMPLLDSTEEIALGYGVLISEFSKFWVNHSYDWVLCLGDRFEMSAAVQSTIPFGLKLAHLHGGETTLGAIDNIYRHQISLASSLHLTAAEQFSNRLNQILDDSSSVHTVGALSIDGLEKMVLPKWELVSELFQIPNIPFVLVTFHPETVNLSKNIGYIEVLKEVLSNLSDSIHIVITLANADTMGSYYRAFSQELKQLNPEKFSIINSFGKMNYFSAMKSCDFMLGNTSSGIIEAASFNKYVVNVGSRQEGRMRNENVIDVPFDLNEINSAINKIKKSPVYKGINKYGGKNTSETIMKLLLQ